MSGGGDLPPYEFSNPEKDYTINREYDDSIEMSIRTKHTLYILFSVKYPEKSKDELCYIIDGISSLLYIYFNYIGEYTDHEEFLKIIMNKYDAGNFGSQTLDEFKYEFKAWAYDEEVTNSFNNYNIPSSSAIRHPKEVIVYGGGSGRRRKTQKNKRSL